MADFRLRIEAEYEAIQNILAALPALPLANLSKLEIAGVASLLHNLYNAMENILRQAFQAKSAPLPCGESWHRDLLMAATECGILSACLRDDLKPYLAFRHFFSHGYALNLFPGRMDPLVRNARDVFARFRSEIEKAMT